jgi:Uma2 family endonuclease
MAAKREPGHEYMTGDEFEDLLLDKPEDEKWELIGGRLVRGMVGGAWEHQKIIGNIVYSLERHLRGAASPCRVFRESFWLKEKSLDLCVFPDVMVFCSQLAPGQTSINDPLVLVEVASKGSLARDRIEKGALYQQLPSLQHFVVVLRHKRYVEVIDRMPQGFVPRAPLTDEAATLNLPALDFAMPLSDIYEGVV